jgi:zinc/manganese transport system permease protein
MNERLTELLANLFAFDVTADLLGRDFVQQALLAAALLALVSGLIGPFIVMRQMSFAVHGSSELSLTGASFALLAGFNVGIGALIGCGLAAVLFGILGQRARERDSAIGVVLAFGLGLAVLFIHLYPGRTGTSFALLTGQIVGVGYSGLALLSVVAVLVVAVLAVSYRPLLFATVDPEVAAGRGVPVRALGIVFAALVGVTAAQGVQIVGALLVMSLLITPAAAAARVFVSPVATIVASVVFAETSAVGGIRAVAAPGVPVSVFVTTISFAIFLSCWLVGSRRSTARGTSAVFDGTRWVRTPFGPRPGYSARRRRVTPGRHHDGRGDDRSRSTRRLRRCRRTPREILLASGTCRPGTEAGARALQAPGMWPAIGSIGSTSPRNRSGARASSRVSAAVTVSASGWEAHRRTGRREAPSRRRLG